MAIEVRRRPTLRRALVQLGVLKWLHESLVKPAGSVKGSPQLGGLVDINLASLLGVGLAEVFHSLITGKPANEDASLAGQVRRTVKAQIACQR